MTEKEQTEVLFQRWGGLLKLLAAGPPSERLSLQSMLKQLEDITAQLSARDAELAELAAQNEALRKALEMVLGVYKSATCLHPEDAVRQTVLDEATKALALSAPAALEAHDREVREWCAGIASRFAHEHSKLANKRMDGGNVPEANLNAYLANRLNEIAAAIRRGEATK